MDARIAEGLVRKWQNIKSQAFGPAHSVDKLSEVKIHLVSVDEIPYLQINLQPKSFFYFLYIIQ